MVEDLGKKYADAVFTPFDPTPEDVERLLSAIHHSRIEHDPAYREEWFQTLARTIAVDFDGVLHPYTEGWQGPVPVDEPPMPGAEEFLRRCVDDGFRVVVFSTRCDTPEGLAGTQAWLENHGLHHFVDDVSCKKPAAVAYVDDRAVPFAGDWEAVWMGVMWHASAGRAHGAGAREAVEDPPGLAENPTSHRASPYRAVLCMKLKVQKTGTIESDGETITTIEAADLFSIAFGCEEDHPTQKDVGPGSTVFLHSSEPTTVGFLR